MGSCRILVINPGSTSTKIAVYEEEKEVFNKNIVHNAAKLARFTTVSDQLPYRKKTILNVLAEQGEDIKDFAAFVGRGGGLQSCSGGVYEVNETLIRHAASGKYGGNHPAALGSQLANSFASQFGAKAFVVNPPDTDEFCDIARITGLSDVFRASHIHTLNQKETAMRVAADMGVNYYETNFIVCHMGGGVSVTAHRQGKMIDSNDIINGDGPMAPTRSGTLPAKEFMDLCYSGKWTREEMYLRLTKFGGFVDHLGTSDTLELIEMIKQGNKYAKLVYDAFQYQIAKYIGSMASVLCGKVCAIIITGGIAHDKKLCENLERMTGWIAPIVVRAGEFEMEALAAGAYRVLKNEEQPLVYTGEPVFTDFGYLQQ